MVDKRPRIIDVERKPQKCPVCGERVVDIIYGTGDMTEIEFVMEYRKEGMMGGDNIPRRPPIWECVCGCRRFRKVNRDGTDASVGKNEGSKTHHYRVEVKTELGEKEIVSVTAVDEQDAEDMALSLVMKGAVGLKGRVCTYNIVVDEE